MADQFCRIVNTTLKDCTLGSDAAQSILTTDASTSYVIRDAFVTNSETCEKLKMTLDLEMDGHKVASGISASAGGSLIVPPSSTLCVSESSGNYPLEYYTYKMAVNSRGGCFGGQCKDVISACYVNDITSGSSNSNPCCIGFIYGAVNDCCLGVGGFWSPTSCNATFIVYCHDGNSNSCIRAVCAGGTFSAGGPKTSYCVSDYADDMIVSWHSSGICVYNAACCYICVFQNGCRYINLSACSPSTYSFIGLSERVNNCWACRYITMFPGNGCSSHWGMWAFNACTCATETIFCMNATGMNNTEICYFVYGNNTRAFPFYSEKDSKWKAVLHGCNCFASVIVDPISVECVNATTVNMPCYANCPAGIQAAYGRWWYAGVCPGCCNLVSWSIDEQEINGRDVECVVHHTHPYDCYSSNGAVKVGKVVCTLTTPTNFSVFPCAQLTLYGIKST